MAQIGPTEPETDVGAETLLAALGGKYSGELLCAAETPRSARSLSEQIDAPIATCYRRIEDLVDAGLLTCVGRQPSGTGKRTNVYRRTVDEVSIDLSGETPELTLQERTAVEPDPRLPRYEIRD